MTTQQSTFTPGPWEVEEGIYVIPASGVGGSIAEVMGDSREEAEANARLIAAAPALYAALQAMVRFGTSDNMLKAARAALALAAGGDA